MSRHTNSPTEEALLAGKLTLTVPVIEKIMDEYAKMALERFTILTPAALKEVPRIRRDAVKVQHLAHAVSDHGDNLMYCDAVINEWHQLGNLLAHDKDDKRPPQEILSYRYAEMHKQVTQQTGYWPNSTAPLHNVKNLCEFRAKQHMYRCLTTIFGKKEKENG